MPGRPQLHALAQKIDALGEAEGVTGDEYVWGLMLDGQTPKVIAASLEVSRPQLYAWRDLVPGRKDAWAAAMKASAESRAEDAGEILDKMAERDSITPAEVSLADKRASHRRWMAGVLDPERFGERQAAAGLTINIQSLHLDALRQAGHMRLNPDSQIAPALAGHIGSGG